jgi:hypothetical protein
MRDSAPGNVLQLVRSLSFEVGCLGTHPSQCLIRPRLPLLSSAGLRRPIPPLPAQRPDPNPAPIIPPHPLTGPRISFPAQGLVTGLLLAPNPASRADQGGPEDQRAELLVLSDWVRSSLAGNLR